MESIVPPLKAEITNLRNDVQRLNSALERIWGCPHVDRCPVKYELLLTPKGGEREPERGDGTDEHHPTKRKPERGTARGDHDEPDGAAGETVTEIEVYDTTQPTDSTTGRPPVKPGSDSGTARMAQRKAERPKPDRAAQRPRRRARPLTKAARLTR